MKILITAPSLDTSRNVSGISAVVNTIIHNNPQHCYFHYLLGRSDNVKGWIHLFVFIKQLFFFPVVLYRNNIDLVHQNLPFDPKGLIRESVINFWCYVFRIPVVLHIHGGAFLKREKKAGVWKNIARYLFRHSRRVIVLSEIEKEILAHAYDFSGAMVLPNAVAVRDYIVRDRLFSRNIPVLLFLGRIHENKGIVEIFEALKLLSLDDISFRFILCGEGSLKDEYIDKFENLLGDSFQYRGVVSGESKIQALRESDFFLLPSYFEGLPMALLEAMAAGLVPVVTEVGSIRMIIDNRKNGVFVQKANSNDLYMVLKELINNCVLTKEISQNAVITVTEEFDILDYIEKMNSIYDKLK